MQDQNAAAAVRTWSQHAAGDGPDGVRRQSRGRGGDAWRLRPDRRNWTNQTVFHSMKAMKICSRRRRR